MNSFWFILSLLLFICSIAHSLHVRSSQIRQVQTKPNALMAIQTMCILNKECNYYYTHLADLSFLICVGVVVLVSHIFFFWFFAFARSKNGISLNEIFEKNDIDLFLFRKAVWKLLKTKTQSTPKTRIGIILFDIY